MRPFRRFLKNSRESEATIIIGREKSARIYISAKHFNDSVWTLALLRRYMKRAERTARLMEKVSALSAQCDREWRQIRYCVEDLGLGSGRSGPEGAETSSPRREAETSGSEDK